MTKSSQYRALHLAALGAALLVAPLAQAVTLNPRGTGQVLLFPYYTVNGGNQTLVTIGNDSDIGKALRIYFRESRNARPVLSLNLYLAPHDQWTAALFDSDPYSAAALLTTDDSCAMPAIKGNSLLPRLPDGRRYAPFVNYAYTGTRGDAGPDGLFRTREGSIEVLEMASVAPDTPVAAAITPNAATGATANCNSLAAAFSDPTYWGTDPKQYLRNPTGGLYGDAAIVNAYQGTLMSYAATALEDFRVDPADQPRGSVSSVVYHRDPASLLPTLADSIADPLRSVASAATTINGKATQLEYPAARAIDAVSAVLMSATLHNSYVDETQAGASTQWVVSLPTRPYYTDPAISTTLAPFHHVYPLSGDEHSACETVRAAVYDRSSHKASQTDPDLSLCYATQVVPWRRRTSPAQNLLGSTLLSAPASTQGESLSESGWASIGLTQDTNSTMFELRPANDGTVLRGLPAIGFAAFGYINGNVRDGVLANYTGAVPHRATTACKPDSGACH